MTTSGANDAFDLLIVGGGINGTGIARDAAGRGLKVALVEQSDLASATSSASTKLVHGGLRYLEFLEFRLVREALAERERLYAIAPHIIQPMEFVLPHVAGLRPRWQIRLGLFFYDHIGGRKLLPGSRGIRIAGSPYADGLKGNIEYGFTYSDCRVDDSRLVVLNAMDAAERGAEIRTRTRFVRASYTDGFWHARCQCSITGKHIELRARAIVNAAGPWVESVLRGVTGARTESRVRLVKGSHIVVPRLYAGEHAFLLQNPDGRVVFTIPYEQHYTLVGTTDVPFDADPASVAISAEETTYLCDTVNRYFRGALTPKDVRWSYAGVRPLSDDDEQSASKVTRDYRLELTEQPGPLLAVIGGKITTYRRLAEAALDKLQPLLKFNSRPWTDRASLPGGDIAGTDFETFLQTLRARWSFLAETTLRRLARTYGTRVAQVLGDARCMEDLGIVFGEGFTEAELRYLQRHEWALTADDVLWRRTKLGLHLQPRDVATIESCLRQSQAGAPPKTGRFGR